MPRRTSLFLTSPRGDGDDLEDIVAGRGVDAVIFAPFGGKTDDSIVRVNFGRVGKFGTVTAGFFLFDCNLPPRARIHRAMIEMQAQQTSSTSLEVEAAFMVSDGLWDSGIQCGFEPARKLAKHMPNNLPGPTDCEMVVQDVGGGNDIVPRIVTGNLGEANYETNADWGSVGQTVTIPVDAPATTLGQVIFRLARTVSAPNDNLRIKVYETNPAKGAPEDDAPELAISDDIAASSVPLSPGDVTFTFSGSNQITLDLGKEYTFILEMDDLANATSRHIFLRVTNSNTYSGGQLVSGRVGNNPTAPLNPLRRFGLSNSAYPLNSNNHLLYLADGTTPQNDPFGSTVIFNMPNFTDTSTYFEVQNVKDLLQEWMDQGGYRPGRIGIQLFPTATNTGTTERNVADWRIRVEWSEPPGIHIT